MSVFNITDLNPASAYVNAMDVALKSDAKATRHETAKPVVEKIRTARTARTSKIVPVLNSLRHNLAHVFNFSRSETA